MASTTEVVASGPPAPSTAAGAPRKGRRLPTAWLGALPFLAYVGIFLILPTGIVVAGAFAGPKGGITFDNIKTIFQGYIFDSFVKSVELSGASSIIGAVFGALLAYAIVSGKPDSMLRRIVTSACGVLAQFGGVTLAFAFIATIGGAGLVYVFFQNHGIDIGSNVWLFELPGLTLVYSYFQIPLMVLVFLPALDGIKPQWREATDTLGGTGWHYWRYVAAPILWPSFIGATLLLFANAFSAYATAAALVNQGGIIAPLQIANALTSETGLVNTGLGKALALGMVVVVALVMTGYALLQRKSARWQR
jgi:putative spermidine/putrescine transport system permease protein